MENQKYQKKFVIPDKVFNNKLLTNDIFRDQKDIRIEKTPESLTYLPQHEGLKETRTETNLVYFERLHSRIPKMIDDILIGTKETVLSSINNAIFQISNLDEIDTECKLAMELPIFYDKSLISRFENIRASVNDFFTSAIEKRTNKQDFIKPAEKVKENYVESQVRTNPLIEEALSQNLNSSTITNLEEWIMTLKNNHMTIINPITNEERTFEISNKKKFHSGGSAIILSKNKKRLHLIGGFYNLGISLNPSNGKISKYPRYPWKVINHCTAYINDKPAVIGGNFNNQQIVSEVRILDGNEWAQISQLMIPRESASCIEFENLLYVIGGKTFGGKQLNSIEVYDGDMWNIIGVLLPVPKERIGVCVYRNKIILLGGGSGKGSRDVWLFNPYEKTIIPMRQLSADFKSISGKDCILRNSTIYLSVIDRIIEYNIEL